jgi:hypothetical protein
VVPTGACTLESVVGERVDVTENAPKPQPKEAYEAPALVELGTLHQLTLGDRYRFRFQGLSVVRISTSM